MNLKSFLNCGIKTKRQNVTMLQLTWMKLDEFQNITSGQTDQPMQ